MVDCSAHRASGMHYFGACRGTIFVCTTYRARTYHTPRSYHNNVYNILSPPCCRAESRPDVPRSHGQPCVHATSATQATILSAPRTANSTLFSLGRGGGCIPPRIGPPQAQVSLTLNLSSPVSMRTHNQPPCYRSIVSFFVYT